MPLLGITRLAQLGPSSISTTPAGYWATRPYCSHIAQADLTTLYFAAPCADCWHLRHTPLSRCHSAFNPAKGDPLHECRHGMRGFQTTLVAGYAMRNVIEEDR